jgi:ubiquinone biosynthesis protein
MATPEFARRVRLTLEDCGGMFVKFGQIASTRNDLLPEALTTELLQSAVRPIPIEEVNAVIEDELGATVAEEFAIFADEPLASASIGQTHRATLPSGQSVVVKVQRPGTEDTVNRDAAVLRMVAGVLERRVEAAQHLGVRDLADELGSATGPAGDRLLRARHRVRDADAHHRPDPAAERSSPTDRSRRTGVTSEWAAETPVHRSLIDT